MGNFKNEQDRPKPEVEDYKGMDARPVYNGTASKSEDKRPPKSDPFGLGEREPMRPVGADMDMAQRVRPKYAQPPKQEPIKPPKQEYTQPPKQEYTQPQAKQKINTNVSLSNPFSKVEEYDLLKGFNEEDRTILDSVIMPAGTHFLISEFARKYKELIGNDDKNRKLTVEDAITLNNANATDAIGMREDTLEKNGGSNSIKHEGVELTGKKVEFTVANTEVSGQVAVTVFNSVVNQTDIFSHNLPSSGFSMSLIDIPEVDVAKLANLLNRTTVRKSRELRGNLFSNYGMLVMKQVLDFITSYIYSTSIDVDDYKLADYIKISDMPIVMLLLMEYIHQKGFEVITSCANTLVYENDKPKCNANIKAVVDLRKLLVVDPDKLETWARKHLSKTGKNAHSVEAVVKYQDTLPANDHKTYTITSGSKPFDIELRNPTMTEAFEAMDQWEELVRDGVTDVTLGKNEEEIVTILNNHSVKTVLGMYLHFIVSITSENGTYVVDRESILDVIVSFNSNREVVADIVKAVKDYISISTVGFVGYTPYVCTQCGHNNGGSDLIALDMTSLGFSLVDLATIQMNSSPHIF